MNTFAPGLRSALSPGTYATMGASEGTKIFFSPSLYLNVSVGPSTAVTIYPTLEIAAGGTLILAITLGAVRFDPTAMIGALAAIIGGTVVFGSNTSTLKQTTTAMKAAEAHRAELISRMDLRVVGDGEAG